MLHISQRVCDRRRLRQVRGFVVQLDQTSAQHMEVGPGVVLWRCYTEARGSNMSLWQSVVSVFIVEEGM